MPLNFEEFQAARHFRSMTGLRFICVLGTLAFHVPGTLSGPWYLGVDMFFVISGFLIVTLLLRERRTTGRVDLKAFYERRTLRIFPIYYLLVVSMLLFALAISPWAPKTLHLYAITFPVMLVYLQDLIVVNLGIFHHTWSLAMEEQFYLLWPAIEKYARRWIPAALVGALALNQAINFGLLDSTLDSLYGFPGAHNRPLFQATFTPILLGVLMAHCIDKPRGYSILSRLFGSHPWTPIALFAAVVLVTVAAPVSLQGWPRLTVHLLFGAFLLSVVLNARHALTWLLDHPVLERLGLITYGIYVYHTVVLEACMRILALFHSNSPWLILVTGTLCSIALAEVSFRFIESPLIRRRSLRRAPHEMVQATG